MCKDKEIEKAFEFLSNNPTGKERQHKCEKGTPRRFPIQYYLSTWEIAKIMVDYAEQRQ